MSQFLQDLRVTLRLMKRTPAMAAVAIGSLTLGIGANTVVFSFVNAIQFKPLPLLDEATLVDVSEWSATELCAGCGVGASLPSLLEWRERARSFSALGGYKEESFVVSGGVEAARAGGALVSSNLFEIIGAQPVRGRGLRNEDGEPDAPPVVLLSDSVWRQRFGSREDLVGSTVKIDGVARTIVGIMPPGFRFPEFAQLWIPLQLETARWPRQDRSLGVIGRLPVLAEQLLEHLVGEHPAVQQRLENRVVQRLTRDAILILVGHAVGIVEAARQEQVPGAAAITQFEAGRELEGGQVASR